MKGVPKEMMQEMKQIRKHPRFGCFIVTEQPGGEVKRFYPGDKSTKKVMKRINRHLRCKKPGSAWITAEFNPSGNC